MICSYLEALNIMKTHIVGITHSESVPLFHASNRIASEPIYASFELPKTPLSLRDGYAVSLKNSSSIPLEAAYFVSTGDALLDTTDAVIALEEAIVHDDLLFIPEHIKKGSNIKHQGEDIALDECLIHPFETLHPYKMTALSAQGISRIGVLKKPRIAILSIGNALTSLGKPLGEGASYNSNAMSIGARCIELGATISAIETLKEDGMAIFERLNALKQDADVIITTGGLSRGDVLAGLLHQKPFQTLFYEVAITPAKPSSLSLLEHTPILHLPGLPLGSILGFELLGVPLLRALQHKSSLLPPSYTQTNGTFFSCREKCTSAIPGFSDGETFTCAAHYEAGRLNVLSHCNGYARIENISTVHKGQSVAFVPFFKD